MFFTRTFEKRRHLGTVFWCLSTAAFAAERKRVRIKTSFLMGAAAQVNDIGAHPARFLHVFSGTIGNTSILSYPARA